MLGELPAEPARDEVERVLRVRYDQRLVRHAQRAQPGGQQVDVLNVFGKANNDIAYYYTSRLPGEAPEGVDDIHFHPAEPRTVRLSISRHF